MNGNFLQYITKAQADYYARCIDDDRLEEWPGLFHGPCLYKITTASNYRDGTGGRHRVRQFARHADRSCLGTARSQYL